MAAGAVQRYLSKVASWLRIPAATVVPPPKVDFSRLLEDRTKTPVSLQEYHDYLVTREYGAESLDFWLAVEHLKTGSSSTPSTPTSPGMCMTPANSSKAIILSLSPHVLDFNHESTITVDSDVSTALHPKYDDLTSVASAVDSIISRFIAYNSPEEINIDATVRNDILDAYCANTLTPATFGTAQRNCYELMLFNSFPRFLASERVVGNIGRDELLGRKLELALMTFGTVALIVCAFTVPGFPRRYRWVLLLTSGWMCLACFQIAANFCIVYGLLRRARWFGVGLYGFRKPRDNSYIEEPCVRTTHLYRTLVFLGISLCFGTAFAGIIYAIPANLH
ncbi:regulator of G protein signaling [Punctularia strigosozonata HHB-11173 SS5]|uniref:regulator of G protein signaling n=1 Tax=Punctularia strigosozonata (strain HHB-11173) TaxID=741275 RepID=UPI0004416684|nr:regulator of G protein signaling [Punctularia strigosozonata HHB-11173 SS5]EIN09813.1 regulator of G protein signaling [Punctularia strigosozonata HHB-11173 SS5]